MGLMKLATYHRLQGWNLFFYKGDLRKFVAERIALRCIDDLNRALPDFRFGKWFPEIVSYIWKRDDKRIKPLLNSIQNGFLEIVKILSNYRRVYQQDEYFSWHEWDRVLVTTLFTFYAEKTIETIRFACRLVSVDKIMVGGVMASVVPDYIKEQTGVTPSVGLLNVPAIMGDTPLKTNIDDLPLDYSILEEIDYEYPASNAFFAHTTRGCVNHCAFCAVPTLEPVYEEYRPLKAKIDWERKMFGNKSNLLLLDNNVFASARFPEIVDEIKACGFFPGAKIETTDPLELCLSRLKDRHPFNPSAWIRKAVRIIQKYYESIKNPEDKVFVGQALQTYNAERDWHGTTAGETIKLLNTVIPLWKKTHKGGWKQAVVDFNQGLDSRLSTNPSVMQKLAEIPVRPVRVAFDHWSLRRQYEQSIRAAAHAGLTHMSNYVLYNFQDDPEELYWRLRLNVALCEELKINIYSFPMKYHPIREPEWFSNRNYLGKHWCRKYVRFVQAVLVPTMGKIGVGKTFFLKAFGTTTDEFRELLLMPEFMIRNRYDCELSGLTGQWRESLAVLTEDERHIVAKFLKSGDYDSPECWMSQPASVQSFLRYYLLDETSIKRPSEQNRKAAMALFEEAWQNANIRMNEDDIRREKRKTESWPFRMVNSADK